MMRVIDRRVHGWDKTMVVRGNHDCPSNVVFVSGYGAFSDGCAQGDGIYHYSFHVLS